MDTKGSLQKILSEFELAQENLLPILHAVQDSFGFIAQDHVRVIANALNISRAEVHGVITYYHHFRTQPVGKHHLQICRAEACQAMGSDQVFALAEEICQHEISSNHKKITVQPVYCLGLCACSPALLLDDTPHGRVTPQGLIDILDQVRGRT